MQSAKSLGTIETIGMSILSAFGIVISGVIVYLVKDGLIFRYKDYYNDGFC